MRGVKCLLLSFYFLGTFCFLTSLCFSTVTICFVIFFMRLPFLIFFIRPPSISFCSLIFFIQLPSLLRAGDWEGGRCCLIVSISFCFLPLFHLATFCFLLFPHLSHTTTFSTFSFPSTHSLTSKALHYWIL